MHSPSLKICRPLRKRFDLAGLSKFGEKGEEESQVMAENCREFQGSMVRMVQAR